MSIVIRRAQPGSFQLPSVLGGRAAAPEEWEVWQEEPGHELVALDSGRVVGGIHVSLVGRTEAWLANLRVHPEFQGRGIASRLVREAEQVARHYGAAVVRTGIPAHDYAAQAVAERGGYRHSLRCVVVETSVTGGPVHIPYDAPVDRPRLERAPDVVRFLEASQTSHAWEMLIPLGWRFRRIVIDLVKGLIKDRRIALAHRPGSGQAREARYLDLQGAALFSAYGDTVVVSCIDGTPAGMQAVHGAILEQAQERQARRLLIFTPEVRFLQPLNVREWAPHPWCPDGFVVVEKSLAS